MNDTLSQYRKIFHGDASRDLWKAVSKKKVHWAVWDLTAACQELEGVVESLTQRVIELERK